MLPGLTLLLVGFSMFAGLLPSVTGIYSDQRFLLCAAIWALPCILFATQATSKHKVLYWKWVLWFLPFLLVLTLAELSPSTYRVEPLMFMFFFLSCALYGGYLAKTEQLDTAVERACIAIALLVLIYGCIALMNYSFALANHNAEIDEVVTWGFPNIRYWSHLATWLLPLLVVAQRSSLLATIPLARSLILIAGATWWWILFTTSARGSILGLFIGACFAVLLMGRTGWPWLRAFSCHALGGLFLWLILTLLIPYVLLGFTEPRGVGTTSSGRWPLWEEAWAMSLVHFPFGMGAQSWLTHASITDAIVNSRHLGHPHNMYLFWAAEYGWIIIAALGLLAVVTVKAVMNRSAQCRVEGGEKTVWAGLLAAVVAACIHAGASAVFMAPASMLTGLMVLAMFLGKLQAPQSKDETAVSGPAHALVRYLSGMFLVAFLGLGALWMGEVGRYYEANMEDRLTYKGQGTIYSPRFWSHGDFPRQ